MSFKSTLMRIPRKVDSLEEPFVLTVDEYRGWARKTKLAFYNYKTGELLDVLPARKTYNYRGEDITDEVCYNVIWVHINIDDPEVWDYLRELKEIQQEPYYEPKRIVDTSNWEIRTHIGA